MLGALALASLVLHAGPLRAAHYEVDAALVPTAGTAATKVPQIRFESKESVQPIPKWLIIGPFKIDADSRDWLGSKFSRGNEIEREENIDRSAFEAYALSLASNPKIESPKRFAVVAGGPTDQIYFDDALGLSPDESGSEGRMAYACCEVFSPSARDVALFVRSDGRLKLWINGNLVLSHEKPGDEYAEKFREVSIIHLREGANFLLAKVLYETTACGFWAALAPDIPNSIQRVADALDQQLADCWCTQEGRPLAVDVNVYGGTRPDIGFYWKARMISHATAGQMLTVPKGLGKAGIGYLKATVRGTVISQPIFVGDPSEAANQYGKTFEAIRRQSGTDHLYAALHRCEHLVTPDHFKPGELDWQRKFATQASIFEEGAHAVSAGLNPFVGKRGEYFRAYKSSIDGSTQYCLVYVPWAASRSGGRLPVVLLTPAVAQTVRPFLDSIYAANGGDWASFRMAEQFGCIVVLPGGRNNAYGNPIGLADMREAVNSLDQDLPIDKKRVFIQGWCSGGMYALMLASFYPDDYRAVGVNFTLTVRSKNSYPPGSSQLPIPVSREWLSANDPFLFSRNLSRIALAMVHHDFEEGPYNDASMALQTPLYAAEMAKEHLAPTVWCFPRPGYYRTDEEELTFRAALSAKPIDSKNAAEMLTSQTKYGEGHGLRIEEQERQFQPSLVSANALSPDTINIATDNVGQFSIRTAALGLESHAVPRVLLRGRRIEAERINDGWLRIRPNGGKYNSAGKSFGLEGPFSHLFSRPFIVTNDNEPGDVTHAAERWCEKFRERWRKDFFVDCRYKPLEDLTRKDWEKYDIVAFCSDPSRSIPGVGCAEHLTLERSEVRIGKQKINGSSIGILALWRNPNELDHYIAVATSNDLNHCDLPDVNFAFDGWFDYLAWQTTVSRATVVLDADRFDSDWR
jgi:hypothetical protein